MAKPDPYDAPTRQHWQADSLIYLGCSIVIVLVGVIGILLSTTSIFSLTEQAKDIIGPFGVSLLASGVVSTLMWITRAYDAQHTTASQVDLQRSIESIGGPSTRCVFDTNVGARFRDEWENRRRLRPGSTIQMTWIGVSAKRLFADQPRLLDTKGRGPARIRLLLQDPDKGNFRDICRYEGRDQEETLGEIKTTLMKLASGGTLKTDQGQHHSWCFQQNDIEIEVRITHEFQPVTLFGIDDVVYVRPRVRAGSERRDLFFERYSDLGLSGDGPDHGGYAKLYYHHFVKCWEEASFVIPERLEEALTGEFEGVPRRSDFDSRNPESQQGVEDPQKSPMTPVVPERNNASAKRVSVVAPSRLHFGLVNTSDAGTKMDGGAGLMIDKPSIQVSVERSKRLKVKPNRLTNEVNCCVEALGIKEALGFHYEISDQVPKHCGLGWKTQLRLAIATSVSILLEMPISQSQLPPSVGRGGTSGVGSWGFWKGGFIVDAGHDRSEKLEYAPSGALAGSNLPLANLFHHSEFPWRVVIGLHHDKNLVHGDKERQLFEEKIPTSAEQYELLHNLIYSDLPSAAQRNDFAAFAGALEAAGRLGFNQVESLYRGTRFTTATEHLRDSGLKGVSMSSWGPTYFGLAIDERTASNAVAHLKKTKAFKLVHAPAISQNGAMYSIDGGEAKPVISYEGVGE